MNTRARTPRPARVRPRLWRVMAALVLALAATTLAAAPPAGKGGGKGGGNDGGGGGDAGGYQPNVRVQCRVALDGVYSKVRPAVGPDGTVYVVDTAKTLHAVDPTPDPTSLSQPPACLVKWQYPGAGNKGVDVGPDGTIYTGTADVINAFTNEGNLKWSYLQDPRAFILADVAVGPDGNVYALATSGEGVFSLDPYGNKRWATPEIYARNIITYTEFAFGPTANGSGQQLYFAANGHTRALRLEDGSEVFLTGGGVLPPRVSPLDGTWRISAQAYTPDNQFLWQFFAGISEGFITPSLGSDGTTYTVGQFGAAYAIDPNGFQRWSTGLASTADQIDVDPTNSVLVLNARATTTSATGLQALTASNGQSLWTMEFPAEPLGRNQFVDTYAAFSATGDQAYVVTAVADYDLTLPRSFLNVVSTDPNLPAASTVLRSTDISISGKTRGKSASVSATVTVMDESRNTISGATVSGYWVMPDGSEVPLSPTDTGGGGQVSFSTSAGSGVHWLVVTDIAKNGGYLFDPNHSVRAAYTYVY